MANPSEHGPFHSSLPNPELNPLQNPTLGRNLGRWAQVYFTSPPEKRAEAVEELLRELEEGAILCPACQQTTAAGQKFCGGCGSPLPVVGANGSGERESAPAQFTPQQDLQWLRERAITSLGETKTFSQRVWWKYGIAGLAVGLLGFGYLEWTAQPHSSNSSAPRSTASFPGQSPRNGTQSGAQPASSARAKTTSQDLAAAPAKAETGAGSGTTELKQAQRLLAGRAVPRDATEAATWLWKAVGKQNITALLLLSDLYVRGDGVPKNCEQGQLLLTAAAKKGSADAARKLSDLQSMGCP